jgi:mRNA interferase MazF
MNNDWQNALGQRVVIIPLTTTSLPDIPFHISIEFAKKVAKILTEQIRSLDKKRIGKKIGELPEEVMLEIEEMLHILLITDNFLTYFVFSLFRGSRIFR